MKRENSLADTSEGPGWWLASDDKWYPPEPGPDGPPNKNKKPWYKRWWFWPIAVIVLFIPVRLRRL
ncbi:MAG: hypothetical protein ACLP41_06360 [Acidimicrobiales bacterium]